MLIYKIIAEVPTRLETLVPNVPPLLVEVIHRGVEPSRERRFSSMRALVRALIECPAVSGPDGPGKLWARYGESLRDVHPQSDVLGTT